MKRYNVLDDSHFVIMEEGRKQGLRLSDEEIAKIQAICDASPRLSTARAVKQFKRERVAA